MEGRAIHSDIVKLLGFPAVTLGRWPTPVHAVAHAESDGVLVKRDDLSGHGRGGVKTRKIERLVGYMLAQGHDEMITAVGNVTNLIHDILPVLKQHDLGWQVYIADDPAMPTEARARLFRDLDDGIYFVGPGKLRAAAAMLQAVVASRARKGRPFLALPSLMHPAGAVGSACGFIEMVSQSEAMGATLPGAVFITVASGTTLAGFLIAENILRQEGHAPIQIIGVQVYPGPTRLWVQGLIRWTERFLGLTERVPARRIELISSALAGGFARFPSEIADLCREVKSNTGLNIDPVFGGKTWSVMETHLTRRTVAEQRPILYWHCGYTPDWQLIDQVVNQAHGDS